MISNISNICLNKKIVIACQDGLMKLNPNEFLFLISSQFSLHTKCSTKLQNSVSHFSHLFFMQLSFNFDFLITQFSQSITLLLIIQLLNKSPYRDDILLFTMLLGEFDIFAKIPTSFIHLERLCIFIVYCLGDA